MSTIQDIRDNFKRVHKYFVDNSSKDLISKLLERRSYFDEGYGDWLWDYGVVWVSESINIEPLQRIDANKELGLFSKDGTFLLGGRFVIPIKDLCGNIIAFVGWNGSSDRKYVTTPSVLFNKQVMLFGAEQYPFEDGVVVVEGIFDSLSLRYCGIPSVAVMGATAGKVQKYLFNSCNNAIGAPDNDKIGRQTVERDEWGLGRYVVWNGLRLEGDDNTIKDVDLLCSVFDKESIKEEFSKALQDKFSYLYKIK